MTLPRDFRSQAYLLMDEKLDYWEGWFAATCQSPIEVAFAVAFMAVCDHEVGKATFMEEPISVDHALQPEIRRVIHVQKPIAQYRVDFLVRAHPYDARTCVVVECDGHDFHERTKEQAARDRARDRDLQSAGYKVFRFTGSEIYRDAILCAREVLSEISRLEKAVLPE